LQGFLMTASIDTTLKQVGISLIIAGCVDLLLVIYSLVSGAGYFSTFFLFAFLAGYQLRRGDLKLASLVPVFALFCMTLIAGILLLLIIFVPGGTLSYLMEQNPYLRYLAMVLPLFFMLLGWIYWKLDRAEVRLAMAERQINLAKWDRNPLTGLALGLVVVMMMALSFKLFPPQP
jgi:hypothetical protein